MADDRNRELADLVAETALDDAGIEALAEAVATPPPPELRDRVLDAVRRGQGHRGDAPPPPSPVELASARAELSLRRWRTAGGIGIAAAAMLAVLYGVELGQSNVSRSEVEALAKTQAELQSSRDRLADRLEEQQGEFVVLEEALAVQQEVVRILSSPRMMTASLARKRGGTGSARVLFDPITGRVAVVGAGLEPPQAGRVYAIWAIRGDGTPQPAGVLASAGGRSFAARVEDVSEPRDVAEFAISIEPEGESDRPTGPIILAGAVDRSPPQSSQ